jgi:hypothetical protein
MDVKDRRHDFQKTFRQVDGYSVTERVEQMQKERDIVNDGKIRGALPMTETDDGQWIPEQIMPHLEPTMLMKVFFHRQNATVIQNAIRYQVNQQTGKIIGQQNMLELLWIMKSVYQDHARHLPCQITEQVRDLNQIVVDSCVQIVIKNLKEYLHSVQRANDRMKTMPHPEQVNQRGTRLTRTDAPGTWQITGSYGGAY